MIKVRVDPQAVFDLVDAGPGLVANTYLEGTYSEFHPNNSQDAEGMRKLFKQFSFRGGIPSGCVAKIIFERECSSSTFC